MIEFVLFFIKNIKTYLMQNPIIPLLEIVFQILLIFFFLRIFITARNAFDNPIFGAISQLTNPVLEKTKKFFNYVTRSYDLSPLLPILLLLLTQGVLTSLLASTPWDASSFRTISGFLDWIFQVYAVIIIITSFTPQYISNPIVSFFYKVSDPLITLTNKFIAFRSDVWRFLSLIFLVLLYVLLQMSLVMIISLGADFSLQLAITFGVKSLALLVNLTTFFTITIIVGALMSWFSPDPYNPLVQFIQIITYPIVEPIRRVIPSLGGIDLSPIFAIFVLQFVNGMGSALINSFYM
ncbi:MAG: YggT family protein [Nitrospinae bacterium]|nr:YggT family protein [Nitrospinota bacterium]